MKSLLKPLRLANEKGQLVFEAVLLMVITLMIATTVTRFLRESEFAMSLTYKPWETLSGMIECGNWSACGKGKPAVHPNKSARNLSLKPES